MGKIFFKLFFLGFIQASWDAFDFNPQTSETQQEYEDDVKILEFPRIGDFKIKPNTFNLADEKCSLKALQLRWKLSLYFLKMIQMG